MTYRLLEYCHCAWVLDSIAIAALKASGHLVYPLNAIYLLVSFWILIALLLAGLGLVRIED